jgi:hypothetical protein
METGLTSVNGPIAVLAVPAGNAGIGDGDVLQRIGTRRLRRIMREPVFEDQPADLPGPVLVTAQATDAHSQI